MTATIACVDVGQGDCTVAVDDQTGEAILIDCRGGQHHLAVEELRRLGLTELRAAIVSHTQHDHFGGVLDALEELADRFTGTLHFNQDSLMATPVAGDERKVAGRKLRALIHRAREFGERVKRAEEDITAPGTVGSIHWELLAPTYDEILAAIEKGDPNLASGVVLIQVGDDDVLIGGDAQLITWERIADRLPKGSVVRWPHHGGALGRGADADARVLALLQPATVIVSVGAANGDGHPTGSFFAAVGGQPGRLLCTQATPACVAGGGPGGVCAGTIRIRADGSGSPAVVPSPPDHAAVIAAFGNGQCR
jgi:beta-lactamase superfamily II metal-dependent hydrolase